MPIVHEWAAISYMPYAVYLFLVIALLDERGPDGPRCNCIASDPPGNEVGAQSLGESCNSSLHKELVLNTTECFLIFART